MLNIMHAYFQEKGGVSFLSPLFELQPLAIVLRLLAIAGLVYVLITVARAFGAAETAQPFQRFARHLERMGDGERAHFHPRAGDTHIHLLAEAFNAAIDKINGRANAREDLRNQLQSILDSSLSAAQKIKSLQQLQRRFKTLV